MDGELATAIAERPPAEPVTGPEPPAAFDGLAADANEEPPLPEEAGAAITLAGQATTQPVEAGPGQDLHVRFVAGPNDRIVAAFAELRTIIKSRPGQTPVVLHIPAGGRQVQEMRLGVGIAYDTELLGQIERQLGALVSLELL